MIEIGIISDSASLNLKRNLMDDLQGLDIKVSDLGVYLPNEIDDYKILAESAVDYVKLNHGAICIGIDLSGNGIQMYANKWANIKAITCFDVDFIIQDSVSQNSSIYCFATSTQIKEIIKLILSIKNKRQ